jgi:lipopolysaccharide export LptBFGC system permease protein LptF
MGFGSFIGGIGLCILSVFVAVFGLAVLLGIFKFIASSYNLPLGIGALIVALLMFAYGWYSYKSGQPKGTLNVHNQ